jgi:hypothetical protein
MNTIKKIVIALNLRGKSNAQILEKGIAVVEGISQNPGWFPNAQPALRNARLQTQVLMQAMVKAAGYTKNKTAETSSGTRELIARLRMLAHYVESVTNQHPEQAETIAALAHMDVKKQGVFNKPRFAMVAGPSPGMITMRALASKKTFSMNFQLTNTPEVATSWKTVQNRTRATARITGLTPHLRYYGRCMFTDRTGTFQQGEVLSVSVQGPMEEDLPTA